MLGHELNNSLTPIKSIARSLETLLKADPLPEDWEEDMSRGLNVIASRSEALSRFMSSYARLAKLPPPNFAPVEINALLHRVVQLEQRMHLFFEEGPPLTIQGDADQFEQALINLVRNAVDAAYETGGRVFVRCTNERRQTSRLLCGMKGRASRTPPIYLCRSSPRNAAARASGWCFAGKLPRRIADQCRCRMRQMVRAAKRG